MKKKILAILILILVICTCVFTFAACGDKEETFKVNFVVDNDIYATIDTRGNEVISIPENPTKEKHSFDGWYWDKDVWEKPFMDDSLLDSPLSSDISVYAKFTEKHTNAPYIVEYYLQNLEDDNYTLDNMRSFEAIGIVGEIASVTPVDIEHFTYNASISKLSGRIDENDTLVLNVYYTRNIYTLSINNASAGSITNAGSYKYGTVITSTATMPNLGYDFGWYSGNKLLFSDTIYTFIVESNVIAKYEVKNEMSNFIFTSSTTVCSITSVMDKMITEISVPNYVTKISAGAFLGCTALLSLEVGEGVVEIGEDAFSSCYNLNRVNYLGTIDTWVQINFEGLLSNPLYFAGILYIDDILATEAILTNIYKINDYAFYNCTSLKSLTTGDSVTSIGKLAFYNCTSLKSLTIGDSVTSIGELTFSNCDSLTSVTIGKGVTTIGVGAFQYCSELVEINFNAINCEDFYNGVFSMINEKAKVVFGDNVTQIPPYLFFLSKIKSVIIGKNVESIGSHAFYCCESLTNVLLGDNVKHIGESAFRNCSSLTSIEIPNSVTSIGNSVFSGCPIEKATIPSIAISSIRNSKLKEVVIIGGDSISSSAFSGCSSLTSIEIPDSVTSIGSSAFNSCSSLTSIVIPNSVTNIGASAFINCTSLTSLTIPENVAHIGDSAFKNNTSITEINFNAVNCVINGVSIFHDVGKDTSGVKVIIGNSVTQIPANLFSPGTHVSYHRPKINSLIIGNNVKTIGEEAFYNCNGLTSVVIPESVERIGYAAFYNCTSLTSATFKDTSTWYITSYSTSWEKKENGTYINVTNSSTNAINLNSEYRYYYLYKK